MRATVAEQPANIIRCTSQWANQFHSSTPDRTACSTQNKPYAAVALCFPMIQKPPPQTSHRFPFLTKNDSHHFRRQIIIKTGS